MAPHSSTLAWQIPWTEEPWRLQSMESLRVGHDWATSLLLFTFMHWRRKWQPTPVFLPGESQGWGSLVGCCLWGSHRVGDDWSNLAAEARTITSSWSFSLFSCSPLPHLRYTSMSITGSSSCLYKYPPAFREQCFLCSTGEKSHPTVWTKPSIAIPATTSSSDLTTECPDLIFNFLLASSHKCSWSTVNSLKKTEASNSTGAGARVPGFEPLFCH